MHNLVGTYRIQFNPSFDFKSAKDIIPYLRELGISHLYASPIFKARRGSSHGYDMVDPQKLNPELGTTGEFKDLINELKAYDMKWVQDFIPNHMAYDYQNSMLMNVLEQGQRSQYFGFFDIEWDHPCEEIHGRLLAPFLEKRYEETVEAGDIRLNYQEPGLTIEYQDLKFPLKIESYPDVLRSLMDELRDKLEKTHPHYQYLQEALHALDNLSAEPVARDDKINSLKATLWKLYTANPEIESLIKERIETLNGEKGNPESFTSLRELLSGQLFKLSFWKSANETINYRRFFTINFLICLRMEKDDVFQYTHSEILNFIKQGKVDGLRIDHIDGLYNPTKYLRRLRELTDDTYLMVEKILDLDEDLPLSWPVQGTTGYQFLNHVNGVFIPQENKEELDSIYSRFSGRDENYNLILYQEKKRIIDRYMMGDLNNLTRSLHKVLKKRSYRKPVTFQNLRKSLKEVTALLPIYRTYISHERISPEDQQLLKRTLKNALRKTPSLSQELHLIKKALLGEPDGNSGKKENKERLQWVMRWQQFTGPIMAKGLEDTVLYIYNRLLSLNEVGGKPDQFGISLQEFHDFNKRRGQRFPQSLNTTSTHDTKRGEDVRARINVLSEIPQEWKKKVKTWNKNNYKKKKRIRGGIVPDRNEEYLLYQTLVGTFPYDFEEEPSEFTKRIKNYVVKALREAKIHSSWLDPNVEYEESFTAFVKEILQLSSENQFLKDFLPFQKKVAHYGILNSLSQTLLKITCPGAPDFYQGTETWDLNLVDPDNRRPVNFEKRKKLLQDIKGKTGEDIPGLIEESFCNPESGKIKLFLILRGLRARKENPELFQKGSYIPLEGQGKFKEHIISFARAYGKKWAITIAPRFLTSLVDEDQIPLGPVWKDTEIPLPQGTPSTWTNVITNRHIQSGATLSVKKNLQKFPVALLISKKRD